MKIVGVGHHAPARVMTNDDLETMARHVGRMDHDANRNETAALGSRRRSDQRYGAGGRRDALEHAGFDAGDIDCFIVCTVTPDYYFPGDRVPGRRAARRQGQARVRHRDRVQRLHLRPDRRVGLVRSGVYGACMLIGAEKLSKILNHEDRATAMLFGDGAGAVVLEARRRRIRSSPPNSAPTAAARDALRPFERVARIPIDHAALDEQHNLIHMQGREVFKSAVTKMIEATDKALAKAELTQEPTSRC